MESANEIQENVESSNFNDSSADAVKRRKSAGKPKPAPSSLTVSKPSNKALKKSNKWYKSFSEEKMEDLWGQLEERRQDLNVKIREKIASSVNLEFYPSRAALRKESLADKSILSALTSEFTDKFIEVICRIFHTNMAPRDKKGCSSPWVVETLKGSWPHGLEKIMWRNSKKSSAGNITCQLNCCIIMYPRSNLWFYSFTESQKSTQSSKSGRECNCCQWR